MEDNKKLNDSELKKVSAGEEEKEFREIVVYCDNCDYKMYTDTIEIENLGGPDGHWINYVQCAKCHIGYLHWKYM
ncbi:MAG: hypothetical protein MJ168_02705 [Clostridia bacterium]|nr:hypothetical protein [Clostridia bacterium]